jgi:uncharacterized protein YxjI
MRYILRERLFSIGGDAMIQDQRGRDLYFVDGKAISLGRRLEIKELKGRVLATIQQTLIALTPTFEIKVHEGTSARVSLKLLSLRDRLKIDVPGSGDLEAVGDLFRHEYSISRRGRAVAQVSKRWLTIADSYGIEIEDDEDQILLLASAVVIDEILDMRQKADKNN